MELVPATRACKMCGHSWPLDEENFKENERYLYGFGWVCLICTPYKGSRKKVEIERTYINGDDEIFC